MMDRDSPLSITRQAQLVGISRASVYYRPRPPSLRDLALMKRIDQLHMDYLFAGARMLRDLLKQEGHKIGRTHVGTLMGRMGIKAIYRHRNTSKPHPEHRVFPYLLRGLVIDRPNQVWASDITYLPMAQGFMYLTAILDWYARKVLAWRLSNSLDSEFCIAALDEALAKFGAPRIFNTDQGCQFTGERHVERLLDHHIQVSMDGQGRWRDNVLVERLWRTVKYEEVYLHAYANAKEAQIELTRYFAFYNMRRPHRSLDGQTPDSVYFNSLPLAAVA
jgi:putative transposase